MESIEIREKTTKLQTFPSIHSSIQEYKKIVVLYDKTGPSEFKNLYSNFFYSLIKLRYGQLLIWADLVLVHKLENIFSYFKY